LNNAKNMKSIGVYFFALLILLVFAAPGLFFYQRYSAPAPTPTPPQANLQTDEEAQVEGAIRQALSEQKEEAIAILLYDTQIDQIQISEDRNWATGWLIPLDPETGNVVPAEPGLALVKRENGTWKAFLPSDPLWSLIVREVPDDLISPKEKSAWGQVADLRLNSAAANTTYHGYYLPFAGGETMYLTQSVGHDRYTPSGSAHYAFDFAKPGYPSGMFNIHAAKAGRVKQAIWTHPNGDPNNGNYLVLEDTTTSPTTYQLYLHLAQNSIPSALRVVGTLVSQGQFLGIADDTGVSSGNHLHFHVHTYPYSYWGTSVDITFMDVSINGGRPRIRTDLSYCKSSDVCDTTQTAYVSGNYANPDHVQPQGNITYPPHGVTVNSDVIHLSGWASDDNSGIASAQFIAMYNGSWHTVGNPFTTNTFLLAWDMCADNVPDGPVSLALEIQDKAFNKAAGLPGLRHFTKNFTCPSPPTACTPTADQIALFGTQDYQGACVVLSRGDWGPTSLGNLGDDRAVSLQVGNNVQTTLFMNSNFLGRGETFLANDANLRDNRIGDRSVSSLRIQSRGATPATPALVYPSSGATFLTEASLSLVWQETGGGTMYQARLLLNGSEVKSTPWVNETYWHLSALPAGSYTWQVKAKNGSLESNWSSARSLVINAAPPTAPATVNAPIIDTIENMAPNWSYSNYWDLTGEANHTDGGLLSFKYDTNSQNGYDTGAPNAGYLTSPPIAIPATGEYFLSFWYQYETESPGLNWDQRLIQISVDDGEFTNLYQLSDDPINYWLRSPLRSLKAYAGHTVRVRFYFVTLDNALNSYRGWFIDDFSVAATAPPNCADNDNDPFQGTTIAYGSATNATICPPGDIDYYKFQGIAGDQIGVWTEAQVNGSPLDTYIFLLDIDGHSVLVENDDQVLYERSDSTLHYKLSRTGTYYLKVRSWDNPTSGGASYTYRLHLVKDSQDPAANFIFPQEGQSISPELLMLQVYAVDASSGVSHVFFLGHSSDWQSTDWVVLGEDWDGSDGWNMPFNAKNVADLTGIAFYAIAYDWAGNSIGVGAWNLRSPTIYLPLVIK